MPADRIPPLTDFERQLEANSVKFAAARLAQARLTAGLIKREIGREWTKAQLTWFDRGQAVHVSKSGDVSTIDFDTPQSAPISDSIMALAAPAEIPLQLPGLREVEPGVRFFVSTGEPPAAEVEEGRAVPVERAESYQTKVLRLRKFGASSIVTEELALGPVQPMQAVIGDLSRAASRALNRAFVDPTMQHSVFYGDPLFESQGTAVANVDSDFGGLLATLTDGAAARARNVMHPATALHISLLRATSGALAFPSVTAAGGTLCGIPIVCTEACMLDDSPLSHFVGVIDANRIFWARGGATLNTSTAGMMEQSSATGDTITPAAAGGSISLFQSHATGLIVMRRSAWYAADDAGSYFVCAY